MTRTAKLQLQRNTSLNRARASYAQAPQVVSTEELRAKLAALRPAK